MLGPLTGNANDEEDNANRIAYEAKYDKKDTKKRDESKDMQQAPCKEKAQCSDCIRLPRIARRLLLVLWLWVIPLLLWLLLHDEPLFYSV